jgi:alpha/beta superfamily hydrolase
MSPHDDGLPTAGTAQTRMIPGPAGRLEAVVAAPPHERPAGVAVVCHPHPLYGGALSNKVVYTLASCALKAGLVALRFNFRGVGRSEGQYDQGRGETEDALAAVAWLRERQPGAPLWLAGFSFGAYVALAAAARARPAALVSVSIPFGRVLGSSGAFVAPPHPNCPWLALHSRDDEVVNYEETRRALQAYHPPPQLVTLDGAGHFWHGRLGDLQQAVLPFVQRHFGAAAP